MLRKVQENTDQENNRRTKWEVQQRHRKHKKEKTNFESEEYND